MNEINPQQLLSQSRALNNDFLGPMTNEVNTTGESEFGTLLKNTIEQVNESQVKAQELKQSFESGTGDASLAEVMIAAQKADLSFRAMTEVRNKLVTAYQEIMNMPV